MRTGEIITYCIEDRDFLLSIKTGKLSLHELQDLADKEFKELDKTYDESTLSLENSKTRIDELLVELLHTDLKV